MADDKTPTPRAARPAVRLARRRTRRASRMAAVTRLGAEIAAAHSAPRVLRAATRLAPQRPPAAPSALEPAPRVARELVAAPDPSVGTPAGMSDWEAAWIFGGDAGKAIAMSHEDAEARAALDLGERHAQARGRNKLQRSRGARILEGPMAAPEPAPSPPSSPAAAAH